MRGQRLFHDIWIESFCQIFDDENDVIEKLSSTSLSDEQKIKFIEKVALDNVAVHGGRDIPEAVYEALEATIHRYDWEAETRQVILIGDAPPHPKPRGSVTRQEVFAAANEKRININTIIVEAN